MPAIFAYLGFRERDLIADHVGRIVSKFLEEIDNAGLLVSHGIGDVRAPSGDEVVVGKAGGAERGSFVAGIGAEPGAAAESRAKCQHLRGVHEVPRAVVFSAML